jgi:hypothetical protein
MNDRRPTTFLEEGETSDDEMEEFPTEEFSTKEFEIKNMFKSGRQRQQDTAKLWNELQRIKNQASAAAAERRRQIRFKERIAEEAEAEKQRRMEEAAKQRRMEEAAKQQRMEEAAKQRRMEEAAKQQRPHRTDIEKAYIHGEPRAQLIENLARNFGYGGRRRSKKSDTKKYKTRSKSRSRISTKRKNKNRRQTRK